MKARSSLERTLSSLAEMLGAELEFEWAAPKAFANQQPRAELCGLRALGWLRDSRRMIRRALALSPGKYRNAE